MRLRAFLAATALLGGPLAHAAPSKVAVLELHDTAEVGEGATRFLAEQVRGAALGLPRDAWFVMTHENLVALLPPGTDLAACADDCEITTGRAIGADVVVTGEVTRFGRALKVSLKAHQVADGQLVAQETASAGSVEALDEAVRAAAGRLFEALRGPGAAAAAPAVLRVAGTKGLMVLIDGVEVGTLPLGDRRVGAGRHEVALEGPCHRRVTATVDLVAGERRQVQLQPPERTATLKVQVLDAAGEATTGQVFVNDKAVGDAPGSFTVSACATKVRVRGPLGEWRSSLELEAEGTAGITATLGGIGGGPASNAALLAAARSQQTERNDTLLRTSLWWLVGGAAIVGLGGLMANANQRNGKKLQENPTDTQLRDDVDTSHNAAITFYVLGGIGMGLGAFGLVARLLSSDPEPAQAGQLRWDVGPGAVGVGGVF